MAIESKKLRNVKNELSKLDKATAEVKNSMDQIEMALAPKAKQPTNLEDKLNKISNDLKHITVGQQKTQLEVGKIGATDIAILYVYVYTICVLIQFIFFRWQTLDDLHGSAESETSTFRLYRKPDSQCN